MHFQSSAGCPQAPARIWCRQLIKFSREGLLDSTFARFIDNSQCDRRRFATMTTCENRAIPAKGKEFGYSADGLSTLEREFFFQFFHSGTACGFESFGLIHEPRGRLSPFAVDAQQALRSH